MHLPERVDSADTQYNINYRQILVPSTPGTIQPISTTSSYDYWWPYPPGGVTTTSSLPVPTSLSSTVVNSLSVANPLSSNVSLFTLTPLSTNSEPTSVSTSTLSSSQTLISINASLTSLSSSATFTSYPKQSSEVRPSASKADTFVIPIFIILGIIVGSIAAWIGWGCLTRKPRIRDFDEEESAFSKKTGRRSRRSELQGGPVYQPSLSERKEYFPDNADSSEKALLSPPPIFSWRALDIDGGRDKGSTQDYLAPPALPSKTSRSKSFVSSKPQPSLFRATTTKTATSVSVYSQVGEEVDEHCEEQEDDRMSFLNEFESDYDPCSPRMGSKCPDVSTPINPRNSSRVVSVSRRRPNHARNGSDMHLGDDLRRSATACTQSSNRTTQTGFRMMEGSPLSTPSASTSSGGFFWGNDEPERRGARSKSKASRSQSNGSVHRSDSYTLLPARRSRSRSNSPTKPVGRSRQTAKQREVSARDKAIEEYYGTGFPQSPPQITSPKLHGSLCFSPKLN